MLLVRGRNDGSMQNAALAAFGLPTDESLAEPEALLLPELSIAVELIFAMKTQWIYAPMGGPIGLNYAALSNAREVCGVVPHEWPGVFADFQALESHIIELRSAGR